MDETWLCGSSFPTGPIALPALGRSQPGLKNPMWVSWDLNPRPSNPQSNPQSNCATGTGFSMYLTVSPSTPLIVNPVFYNTRDNNFVQATLLMTTLWRFLKILILCFCTVVPSILHMQKMCIYVYTEQNIWKKGPDQRGLIPPHLGTSEVCVCAALIWTSPWGSPVWK